MSSSDGPTIVRPIPQRPFDINLTPTSPSDRDTMDGEQHSSPSSPSSSSHPHPPPNFLNASSSSGGIDGDSSISRAASMMNLTSSTLSGIYAPTEEPETPWGTGAQTPVKRFTLQEQQDFSAIELDKEHSSMLRRRLSTTTRRSPPRDLPRSRSLRGVSSLALRALLLFALGTGYGILVTRLRDGSSSTHRVQSFDFDDDDDAEMPKEVHDGLMHPGSDWRYLVFWGTIGVVLGGLLPWFDGVWENAFGDHSAVELDPVIAMENIKKQREQEAKTPSTDWVLVVRGIGAFVGIVFAIRRLPWASSLQASATLALINPFLWYIIDRSKPGFLLSAFVGLTGSAILLGLNPQMMMPPSAASSSLRGYGNYSSGGSDDAYPGDGNNARVGDVLMLGGLASQETVESAVWILSVLFCSCVCFGNIGRRLDWKRGASGRGRWGGLR